MRSTRSRTAVGAVALVAASAVALTGCASWGLSQRGWAGAIERNDGVDAVDWSYDSGFLTTGPRYTGEVLLSDELTEVQAASISEASCSAETTMDSVRVATGAYGAEPVRVEMTIEDESCIDPDLLNAFARTTAAARALGTGFTGDFTVFGIVPSTDEGEADRDDPGGDAPQGATPPVPQPPAGSVRIRATAPESSMLLDALRELHAHLGDRALAFDSSVGSTLSTSPGVTAHLSPGDELEPMLPVLRAALDLPHGAVRASRDGVTVELLSTSADRSDAVAALREAAADAEIDLDTPLPRIDANADPDRESGLISDLVSVPGGAELVFPGDRPGGELEVRTRDLAGTAAAANVLVGAGEIRASFRVLGPDPKRFWVAVRPTAEPPESFSDALTTAMTAERELAEVDRVILDVTRGTTDLTVVLEDTVSRDAAADAGRLLREAARSGDFDEVRLRTPWTDFDQEVVE